MEYTWLYIHLVGMVITGFASLSSETEDYTWWQILLLLCVWPMLIGFLINDLRWELETIRKRITDDAGT